MTNDDIYDIRAGLNFCRDRAEQILARIKELEQIIDEQEVEDKAESEVESGKVD